MFLDWSVKKCRFAPALSFLSSFDLEKQAGMPSHSRKVLPPGDPDGVLITSVSNQGDDFSSISAF